MTSSSWQTALPSALALALALAGCGSGDAGQPVQDSGTRLLAGSAASTASTEMPLTHLRN